MGGRRRLQAQHEVRQEPVERVARDVGAAAALHAPQQQPPADAGHEPRHELVGREPEQGRAHQRGGLVEQVNRDLAADSQLASSQIRRFLILHKELDADDGELTRTLKVRRRIVGDKYKPLIDALYSDAENAYIEVDVTFEDGRKGKLSADLRIEEAAVEEQAPLKKAS